jgi:hypothetical protein
VETAPLGAEDVLTPAEQQAASKAEVEQTFAEAEARAAGTIAGGGGAGRSSGIATKIATVVNGVPGTIVKYRDGTEEFYPAGPSVSERARIGETEATEAGYERLLESFNPSFVGPVAGRLGEWSEVIPGVPVDPVAARFRAQTAEMGNKIIHDLSGAAVTPQEAVRIQKQIPKVTDKPDVFVQKLRNTIENQSWLVEWKKFRAGLGPRPASSTIREDVSGEPSTTKPGEQPKSSGSSYEDYMRNR